MEGNGRVFAHGETAWQTPRFPSSVAFLRTARALTAVVIGASLLNVGVARDQDSRSKSARKSDESADATLALRRCGVRVLAASTSQRGLLRRKDSVDYTLVLNKEHLAPDVIARMHEVPNLCAVLFDGFNPDAGALQKLRAEFPGVTFESAEARGAGDARTKAPDDSDVAAALEGRGVRVSFRTRKASWDPLGVTGAQITESIVVLRQQHLVPEVFAEMHALPKLREVLFDEFDPDAETLAKLRAEFQGVRFASLRAETVARLAVMVNADDMDAIMALVRRGIHIQPVWIGDAPRTGKADSVRYLLVVQKHHLTPEAFAEIHMLPKVNRVIFDRFEPDAETLERLRAEFPGATFESEQARMATRPGAATSNGADDKR